MPELEIPQGFSIAEEPKLEIPQGFSLSKEPELQVPGGFSIAEEPELQIPEGFSLGEPESGMPDAARRAIGTLAPVKQAKYLGGVLQNPIVQRILESTRESTVGLGGIARGIRTGISSGEAGSALEAASESIKQRRGLGKEIVDPLMEPGIKKGIAGFAAEVATDPINFITLGGITRLVSKAARVARPIVKVGVARKAAQQVGEFSGIRVSGDDLITELERVVELSNKAKEASIAPQAIMTTAERDLLKQYAPQIKSAQDFKVPMRALVSETEKRAFVKSMAGQPMEAVERQVVQPLKELPPIETPPISRIGGETLSVKAGNFSQRFEKRMANIEELNTRAKLAVENVESIGQTGTLPKDIRPGFRKTQPFGTTESEIRAFRVSQNSVKQSAKELINAVTEFQTLERELIVKGDALSSNTARAIGDQLRGMKKKINAYAEGYSMQRFATNRALKGFDGPVPRGIIDTLKQQGVIIKGLTQAKERLPITTNILKGLKNFNKMTPVERHRFWGDVVDQFRLNLFAAHSFTLDVIGNAGELTAQVASGVGHDLVYMAKGKPTFPMTSGFLRAIRDRGKTFGHPIIKPIEEGFGMTASGEFFGGLGGNSGAFTMRSTLGSKIFDYLVGGPLYLKGFADSEAKRFAATASLWKTATKTADKMKLAGTERTIFYEKFMREIPDSAIDDAIVAGNKAGFNRELTATEEKIASSIGARLFVDAFARWPFQFARWGMEMVGYNKAIWKKIKAGTVGAEEVGEYVTKTATGWGGIYMLDRTLYDRVDFSTLEYVHPTGNRTRLSNREPLATGLILLAIMKGDADKAAAGMKFASLPGARLLTGEGGLLTSIVAQFNNFAESRKVSPRRMYDEVSSVVNRMIPGQALLGTIKTIFDPVIREGIGANIPGVSLLKPSVPKPTTGEPLRPRQKLPFIGTEVPSVVGGVIPGAERIMDPIEILLRDYGFTPYKGMRSPIAGVPPNEIPPHLKREWTIELGKARQQYFGPLVNNPTMLTRLKESDYDVAREIVQGFDSDAAATATMMIEKRHGIGPIGDRQLTGRERSLPEVIKKKIQRDRDKKINMRMGKSFKYLPPEEQNRYIMENFGQ